MQVSLGDRVIVESERLARPPRRGFIEAIPSARAGRYLVRWDDGRTSLITPAAGALQVMGDLGTSILFRALNDLIRRLDPPRDVAYAFACECGDETCTRVMRMQEDEYDALRCDPGLFAVVPGHEEDSSVVGRSEGYLIVRKRPAPVARGETVRSESRGSGRRGNGLRARLRRLFAREPTRSAGG